MADTIGTRLKVWRKSNSLKQVDAANTLGLPASTYQNYERDMRAPNAEGWEAFLRAGINTNWLLSGSGPMLLVDFPAPQTGQAETEPREGFVKIDAYPFQGNASSPSPPGVGHLMFREKWIIQELGAKPENLSMIRVSGDSMEPTLRAGDLTIVDLSASQPDYEGIYALKLEESLLLKRIQVFPGGKLMVSSDNSAFSTWTINRSDLNGNFAIIGRVVWSGRRF